MRVQCVVPCARNRVAMPRMGSGGGITGLVALLGGGTFLLQSPQEQLSDLPVVKVNDDDSLISYWPSEDLGAAIDAPMVPPSG